MGILHWQPRWLEAESCHLADLCLDVSSWSQPKAGAGVAGVLQNQSPKHCYHVQDLEKCWGGLAVRCADVHENLLPQGPTQYDLRRY